MHMWHVALPVGHSSGYMRTESIVLCLQVFWFMFFLMLHFLQRCLKGLTEDQAFIPTGNPNADCDMISILT